MTWEPDNRGEFLARACLRVFWLVLLLGLCACARAYADVGVVLNESLDTSVARVTGSGHSAVYVSRICPESPVKVRLCRPGEEGSVISNYTTLGEDQPFEWNIVPLSIYLYGVEDPRNRPLFGSEKVKHALEERYRQKYLAEYCQNDFCLHSNKAEWREMVGATISRNVYLFVIKTTVEQDEQLIAELNASPNQNRFNGVTRNCATFTRHIINTYFPGATRPNYINDFGMTSPKAIARSFTRYARHHPESDFRVLHFAQVPGTYKRSSECREGTEQLYHSKKLLVPMLIFAPHELPFAAGSYVLTGRFNPERTFEKFATLDEDGDNVAGTKSDWKEHRDAFGAKVEQAIAEEVIPSRDYLARVFKRLDQQGTPVVDEDGSVWIQFAEGGPEARVGVSASNLLSRTSDPELADRFVLARIHYVLNSPKHSRETMVELRADWVLLDRAETRRAQRAARETETAATSPSAASDSKAKGSTRSSGDE